ncbi:MAG TPA: glycosyltransferase family 4 protein [Dongiaceae bacterium]
MRIAFYAPLKPPTHPVPSGDRRMARLLMAALARANHQVTLASRFRSREGEGDAARQESLARIGLHTAERLAAQFRAAPAERRPEAWFTYHLYYKAPDFLGPRVSAALDIPYLVAEASHAPKQAKGKWAKFHAAAESAIAKADAIFSLNPVDTECLKGIAGSNALLVPLRPFLDGADFAAAGMRRDSIRAEFARRFNLAAAQPWLLAVAMMRDGDKYSSYRVLAQALQRLTDMPWQLLVVGDGPVRPRVEEAFAPLPGERVRYAGARTPQELPDCYAAADLFVWPAINEAYGMSLLEAQAAGLPVVAGATGGVPYIINHDHSGLLTPTGDVEAFAAAIRELLRDTARRRAMGDKALETVASHHDVASAAATLDRTLRDVIARRRRKTETLRQA